MIKTFVNNQENTELFTLMNFPGGEPHAKLNRTVAKMGDKIDIVLKGSDLHEYAQVLMMQNLLEEFNVKPSVFVPYLGGARADKDKTIGWKCYADIVKQFNNLTIADIHSDRHLSYLKDPHVIRVSKIIPEEILDSYDLVIAPDAGAIDRARSVSYYEKGRHYAPMNKVRDQSTGRIIEYGVYREDEPLLKKSKKALVVDDICDGGMTFKLLAENLQGFGLKQLDLYVTHGIFSGNAKENLAAYDNIYTTNSLESASNVQAHIIDIERIYLDNSGPIPN